MTEHSTDELRGIADALEKAEAALAWIAVLEGDEDQARTLADNETLHRVAGKFRAAADAHDASGEVGNPDGSP